MIVYLVTLFCKVLYYGLSSNRLFAFVCKTWNKKQKTIWLLRRSYSYSFIVSFGWLIGAIMCYSGMMRKRFRNNRNAANWHVRISSMKKNQECNLFLATTKDAPIPDKSYNPNAFHTFFSSSPLQINGGKNHGARIIARNKCTPFNLGRGRLRIQAHSNTRKNC